MDKDMVRNAAAMDDAVGWIVRQSDPRFRAWEEFTAWLEESDANAAAYTRLSVNEAEVAERLRYLGIPANAGAKRADAEHSPVRRRILLGGMMAAAASAVAIVGLAQFAPDRSLYAVSSAPGIPRSVLLEGGSKVEINGDSTIMLDRDDPRYAEVKNGQALFTVIHDPDRPFRVKVARSEIVDLGTRFDVVRDGGVTEVAVSEGTVMFNPDGEAAQLLPGQKLRATDGGRTLEVSEIPIEAVGSWTEGRLIYDNSSLALVARDLGRLTGKRVRADAAVAARPVTAIIHLPEDLDELAPRLENLLGVKVKRAGDEWVLMAK